MTHENQSGERLDWPSLRLRFRVKWDVDAGRLLTTIQLFGSELPSVCRAADRVSHDDVRECELGIAHLQLQLAKNAANKGRIEDGWHLLHSARRHALIGQADEELKLTAGSLRTECAAKLTGWRRTAALAAFDPENGVPTAAQVAEAARQLDENSQNVYIRLRLLGLRLVVAAFFLVTVIAGLGLMAWKAGPGDTGIGVLHDGMHYWSIAGLGALGALLSFAIGTMQPRPNARIYELAIGIYVTTFARVAIGSAAALVVAATVETRVLSAPIDWVPALAVVAGFSERFVRRIVESISATVERPDPDDTAADTADAPAASQPPPPQPRSRPDGDTTPADPNDRTDPPTHDSDAVPPTHAPTNDAPPGSTPPR